MTTLHLLALHCADVSSTTPPTIFAMQETIMRKALLSEYNLNIGIESYLQTWDIEHGDCCAWRGVSCTDGIVNQLVIIWVQEAFGLRVVDLPHTLQFLHLQWPLFFSIFQMRDFPRDSKYIYVNDAEVQIPEFQSVESTKETLAKQSILDIAHLPSNVEEVHLYIRSPSNIWRTVLIHQLPPKLALLFIMNADSIQRVHIGPQGLPVSLQEIIIGVRTKIPKFVGRKDGRVQAWKMDRVHAPLDYKYFSGNNEVCEGLLNCFEGRDC